MGSAPWSTAPERDSNAMDGAALRRQARPAAPWLGAPHPKRSARPIAREPRRAAGGGRRADAAPAPPALRTLHTAVVNDANDGNDTDGDADGGANGDDNGDRAARAATAAASAAAARGPPVTSAPASAQASASSRQSHSESVERPASAGSSAKSNACWLRMHVSGQPGTLRVDTGDDAYWTGGGNDDGEAAGDAILPAGQSN